MARILFVEDDNEVRPLVGAALERAGHEVTASENGLDALARLGAGIRYDLVILDLLMPTLSGWEVLERLEATPYLAGTPVLVTSAFSLPTAQLGRHAFLRKPYGSEALLAEVQRLARPRAAG